MKKNLGKIIVSCAAIMSVSAAMAISASAASYADGVVTNEGTLVVESGKQATILVAKDATSALTENDIFFIDQQTSSGSIPTTWKQIKVKTLEAGDYVLKMGGEGVTQVEEQKFSVSGTVTPEEPIGGTSYTIGDVNKDGTINTQDSLRILQAYAKIEGKEIAKAEKAGIFELADVNGDGTVNTQDSLRVLQSYAKIEGKALTETVTVYDN